MSISNADTSTCELCELYWFDTTTFTCFGRVTLTSEVTESVDGG